MNDYDRIAKAIAYLTDKVQEQPSLEDLAAHLHLSPFHLQRLFTRWAGTTPKRFLQVLTLELGKKLLDASASVLETSATLGLSSTSRLYDHFVQLEAVTPGEYKSRGAGMVIEYGCCETPFGPLLLAQTARGICKAVFLDAADTDATLALQELKAQWPLATLQRQQEKCGQLAARLFNSGSRLQHSEIGQVDLLQQGNIDREVLLQTSNVDRAELLQTRDVGQPAFPAIKLHVQGTNFQIAVWRALLRIPPATAVSYSHIAAAVGASAAARAAGSAIGANPVAVLIPCHRVIQQSGALGGYRWGTQRKLALQAWEKLQMKSGVR